MPALCWTIDCAVAYDAISMLLQCYYCQSIIVVNQSSAKIQMQVSIKKELKTEFENELDYSILDN